MLLLLLLLCTVLCVCAGYPFGAGVTLDSLDVSTDMTKYSDLAEKSRSFHKVINTNCYNKISPQKCRRIQNIPHLLFRS